MVDKGFCHFNALPIQPISPIKFPPQRRTALGCAVYCKMNPGDLETGSNIVFHVVQGDDIAVDLSVFFFHGLLNRVPRSLIDFVSG